MLVCVINSVIGDWSGQKKTPGLVTLFWVDGGGRIIRLQESRKESVFFFFGLLIVKLRNSRSLRIIVDILKIVLPASTSASLVDSVCLVF